ncbi:hypothetical protein NQZ68_026575 [Dissostichus eleginoides]|nr:hypothetical protein NQZ68_026575 [Dissostichus eleginoides]
MPQIFNLSASMSFLSTGDTVASESQTEGSPGHSTEGEHGKIYLSLCAESIRGGGGLIRRAASFYLTPWDEEKSAASLRPPTPHLTSICRGTGPTAAFVWGVVGHD